MPLYTLKPIPVFEARQVNTQEDADAWVASLTENELVSGGRSFTNVRIEVDEDTGTMWLKFTDTSEVGSEDYAMDTDIGGYAIANKDNTVINIWVEGVENFTRRYQTYPVQP